MAGSRDFSAQIPARIRRVLYSSGVEKLRLSRFCGAFPFEKGRCDYVIASGHRGKTQLTIMVSQIPAVRFLESLLCHRYTSCPILRPCSKLDMELHMAAMAALGGRTGQRSALLLWCSWLANFSSGCQSGNKIAGTSRTPGHLHARHPLSSKGIPRRAT